MVKLPKLRTQLRAAAQEKRYGHDHTACMYDGHSTCTYYDYGICMYHDHTTCMYDGHSTCMYYDHDTCMHHGHSTCMSYGHSTCTYCVHNALEITNETPSCQASTVNRQLTGQSVANYGRRQLQYSAYAKNAHGAWGCSNINLTQARFTMT